MYAFCVGVVFVASNLEDCRRHVSTATVCVKFRDVYIIYIYIHIAEQGMSYIPSQTGQEKTCKSWFVCNLAWRMPCTFDAYLL